MPIFFIGRGDIERCLWPEGPVLRVEVVGLESLRGGRASLMGLSPGEDGPLRPVSGDLEIGLLRGGGEGLRRGPLGKGESSLSRLLLKLGDDLKLDDFFPLGGDKLL